MFNVKNDRQSRKNKEIIQWRPFLQILCSGWSLDHGQQGKKIMNLQYMRSKARGLAQHGGPPGWLEESDPAGVILYVMGTGRTACLCRTVSVALALDAQLRADEISSCCYLVNVHNRPSWSTAHDVTSYTSRKEGMALAGIFKKSMGTIGTEEE